MLNDSLEIRKVDAPDHFFCPLSMEKKIMENPFTGSDGRSYEKERILKWLSSDPRSPITKEPMTAESLTPNRVLKDAIEKWRRDNLPRTALFLGKFGTGKSKTINSVVGKKITKVSSAAEGVTAVSSIVFNDFIGNKKICIIDGPGLCDPMKKDEETLIALSNLLVECQTTNVTGFDTLFHCIKRGRIDRSDVQIPLTILDSLCTNDAERKQLAANYCIIVTHSEDTDFDDLDVEEARIREDEEKFKFIGAIKALFPKELSFACDNMIFIENNAKNQKAIQKAILDKLDQCKSKNEFGYQPTKLLSQIIEESHNALSEILEREISSKLSPDEIIAMQNYFNYINRTGTWSEPREEDRLPKAFVTYWATLKEVSKHRIALDISNLGRKKISDVLIQNKRAEEEREKEGEEGGKKVLVRRNNNDRGREIAQCNIL